MSESLIRSGAGGHFAQAASLPARFRRWFSPDYKTRASALLYEALLAAAR
jgi:hypothetical protein